MSAPLSLGVLASGSGTNLQAILDACDEGRLDARVAVVVTNIPGARAFERAEAAGVPAVCHDHTTFADRGAFDAAIAGTLLSHEAQLVVLAGFMRLLGPAVLDAFPGRIVNIHPSLLPAFPGLHAPEQALAKGVRITGCTVHLVDAGTDSGPVLAQAAVPVHPGDDAATLQARIQHQEHRLYPQVLQWIVEGRLAREDGRTHIEHARVPDATLVVPSIEERP